MTAIEWTDATWNPVTGCSKISAGCKFCYAERMARRLRAMGSEKYRNGFAVTTHSDALDAPLGWKRPRRIFVNSMSDLFHAEEMMGRHRLHDCRPVWFVTVSLWRWPPVRAHELCDYPGVSEMWRERAEVAEAKYPGRPEPRRQALLICIGGAVEVQSELVHCDWLSPRTARIIADMVDRCRGPGWPR